MATKKITDLVEITTAASDDVLPIVDVSQDITKKITTSNLLATKQDTLVSGTNIKTINSTSLLGSGDISIQANQSGGAGAIQFSDGSAFASDTNLFWDNTNKRLGVGETTPTARVQIKGEGATSSTIALRVQNSGGTDLLKVDNDGAVRVNLIKGLNYPNNFINLGANAEFFFNSIAAPKIIVNGAVPSATQVSIKGSGSTSATTALLVQNSGGNNALQVRDDRVIIMAGLPISSSGLPSGAIWNDSGTLKIV